MCILHKIRLIGAWVAVMFFLFMASCVNEDINVEKPDIDPPSNGTLSGNGPFYFSFRLAMADGTPESRAGKDNGNEFVDGSVEESKISNMMIIFFNENGDFAKSFTEGEMEKVSNSEVDIESDWTATWTIKTEEYTDDIKNLVNSFSSFITVVNYDENEASLTSQELTLESFYSQIRDNYQINGKGFYMTTAGRYVSETGGNKYLYYNTNDNNKDFFYNSRDESIRNAHTVYVERLASRVDISIDKNHIEPIEVVHGTDIYNLTFNPTHWGLNGTETSTYLAKHQPKNGSFSNDYPSNFFGWINYNNKRTFWAESVNFDKSLNYPANANSTSLSNPHLNYLSFGTITSDLFKDQVEGKETGTVSGKLYTLEHTFNYSDFNNNNINPYAVPTSIVVLGDYTAECTGTDLVPDKDENGKSTSSATIGSTLNLKNGGFYLRNINIERNGKVLKHRLYVNTEELFDGCLKEQYTIWICKKDDKGSLIGDHPVKADDNLDIFEIVNTYMDYVNGTTKAPNQYTLQLKEWDKIKEIIKEKEICYANYSNSIVTYTELTADNLTASNEALQKQLGTSQYYDKGKAFFYSPIPHYLTYSSSANSFTGVLDRNNYKTGDFGVVRNHIYNFTIEAIHGLGYGKTDDKDIPLPYPREDENLYQFDMELKILPWNIFEYTLDI